MHEAYLPSAGRKPRLPFIGPDNSFCSESDNRFRPNGEKAARLISLRNPGFANQTRRGISPSSSSA
jgi:hypothetical protein